MRMGYTGNSVQPGKWPIFLVKGLLSLTLQIIEHLGDASGKVDLDGIGGSGRFGLAQGVGPGQNKGLTSR